MNRIDKTTLQKLVEVRGRIPSDQLAFLRWATEEDGRTMAELEWSYHSLFIRLIYMRPELFERDVLRVLQHHCNYHVRQAVVEHPHCPQDVLLTLVRDLVDEVRLAVALRDDCPPSELATLATDLHWRVRAAVALHPSANAETLSTLRGDPMTAVAVLAGSDEVL